MASTLPPDPYLALGVPKDADPATIKSTYRKLALKCHPDKVADESLKQQKQEEFHKIQQAYELVGVEEKRAKYDAEVRLELLRREKQARSGPSVEVKTTRYETRTAAPAGATFSANGPSRYEERKPAPRPYEDDRYFAERSARKYDTYEAYPRQSSSRTSRPERDRATKASTDRTRSDRNKTRDKEERRERSGKFVHIDDESSSNDEKARYEAEYRRRSEDDRRRRDEEEARKVAADARRKAEDRRSYEEPREPRRHRSGDDREFDRQRKLSEMENDAVRYIHRSKVEADPRPSPSRTTSSRDARPDPYDTRSSRRPEPVRRSSARPKERDAIRDRKGIPEIVEWEDDRKQPPPFKHSSSSPAEIHVPRATPQRSHTESTRDHRRIETSPTPLFRRSETMPTVPSSSSRRKEATVSRSAGLRSAEPVAPREPELPFPTVPPPRTSPSTTKYYYPTPDGGVSLRAQDVGVANGHRTVLREPDRHRQRSPSPLGRPPIGANRPVEVTSSRMTSSNFPPPPLGRSGEDRGRRLYGEVPSDFKRENARRKTSFSPDNISYARKIGPEDISWSASRKDEEYSKPTLGRHATYVY